MLTEGERLLELPLDRLLSPFREDHPTILLTFDPFDLQPVASANTKKRTREVGEIV
jgi:hypothetical protein